ncbi:hypothetical protein AVEN_23675-1 [Araneus ventricosus]|uniref:Uncharacterized protein n=1 Tax=Araneus ventricosus TaxID=182803 RepID=A0A4Y2BJ61_ARAVE|nr:hypothetical protein AVEN_23675-1 [Araneus ventricosus]
MLQKSHVAEQTRSLQNISSLKKKPHTPKKTQSRSENNQSEALLPCHLFTVLCHESSRLAMAKNNPLIVWLENPVHRGLRKPTPSSELTSLEMKIQQAR